MTLFTGVALVTGAASGIGRQVAISFAAEGCERIAILDRDSKGLQETQELVRQESSDDTFIHCIFLDVLDEESIVEAFRYVRYTFQHIEYAVNCAGIYGVDKPSHELSPLEFDKIMNTNFRGLWLCAREELKIMMGQDAARVPDGQRASRGSIVNVGSNLALVSKGGTPAYNASKAAIVSLTKTDAIDYSKYNIRVNCVCPGLIDTPMTAQVPQDDPVVQIAPMKRKGTPQEVADAVLFLSSHKASFCQGAVLPVDGGYTIN